MLYNREEKIAPLLGPSPYWIEIKIKQTQDTLIKSIVKQIGEFSNQSIERRKQQEDGSGDRCGQ